LTCPLSHSLFIPIFLTCPTLLLPLIRFAVCAMPARMRMPCACACASAHAFMCVCVCVCVCSGTIDFVRVWESICVCGAVQAPQPAPAAPRGCAALGLGSTSIACLDVVLLLVFLNLVVLLPAGVFYIYQRERGLPRDLASLAALARGNQSPGDREPLLPPEEQEALTEAAIDAAEFEDTVRYPAVVRGLREFFRGHVRCFFLLP
jgi:hypothetical protein